MSAYTNVGMFYAFIFGLGNFIMHFSWKIVRFHHLNFASFRIFVAHYILRSLAFMHDACMLLCINFPRVLGVLLVCGEKVCEGCYNECIFYKIYCRLWSYEQLIFSRLLLFWQVLLLFHFNLRTFENFFKYFILIFLLALPLLWRI